MASPRKRSAPEPVKSVVTIRDVAKEAGCSITAVSWSINGNGTLSAETRSRVLAACKRLGYVTNSAGRNLRMKRSDTVGLLFPRSATTLFHNVFYADITAAFLDGLAINDLHLLICLYDPTDANFPVPAVITQSRVDAAVVLGAAPQRFIEALADYRVPLLLLDTGARGLEVDSVSSAGVAGATAAVEYLLSAGHRRLLMVIGDEEDANTNERVTGFRTALRKAGISSVGSAPLAVSLCDFDQAYARLRQKLATMTLPVGVVMVNDTLAAQMVRRLQVEGVRVPAEVSVVSFNDDNDARTCEPPLTTLAIDRVALGRRGAELIKARLDQPTRAVVHERLPMQLIERASVARVNPARR